MSKRGIVERVRIGVAAIGLAFPALAPAVTTHDLVMYAVGDGAYGGRSYTGSFAYDEAVVSPSGQDIVKIGDGLESLSFDFEGTTFAASHDWGYNTYPQIWFSDGKPTYIYYWLYKGVNGVNFADSQIDAVSVTGNLVPATGRSGYAVAGRVLLVPEPATVTLLLGGLAGLALVRRVSRRP